MKTFREYIDIINEAQHTSLDRSAVDAIPGVQRWDDLDNSSPYKAYRFGVALAAQPEKDTPPAGPSGQKMITVAYTDVDHDIIQGAGKNIGAMPTTLTSKGSHETSETNSVSPVKAFRGY